VNITGVMVLNAILIETQDRIRGTKGKKVLRTRKIQVKDYWIVRHHLGIGFVVIIANKIFGINMVHR
jgi:hypothetical protein